MLWADITHDVLKYVCLNLFKAFKIRKPSKYRTYRILYLSGYQNVFESRFTYHNRLCISVL